MVCEVCERDLNERAFPAGSTICNNCLEKMHRLREGGGYSESKGCSVNRALLRLVEAIRDQAEADGELDDFYEYWVESENLRYVWWMLWQAKEEKTEQVSAVKDIPSDYE